MLLFRQQQQQKTPIKFLNSNFGLKMKNEVFKTKITQSRVELICNEEKKCRSKLEAH
jgi:hypothetical protein